MLTQFFEDYVERYEPYKGGDWCYEDGCIYRGLELLHRATGEDRWFGHLKRLVDAQIAPGPILNGYSVESYNIDNILSGRALLYLHGATGEQTYLDSAALLVEQLSSHPRTNSGVYWHKLRYPWQIWLDGLYMGLPFQIGYGLRTGNAGLCRDALRQADIALSATFRPETGLYAHGFDEAREQHWADAETGHSQAHWARALGWLAMALVDIAELVDVAEFDLLRARTEALLKNLIALRQKNGLWLQVIDQPDLVGNYEESSASAMFVYSLLKGMSLGLCSLPETGLLGPLVKASIGSGNDDRKEMIGICEVAGLGGFEGRYRDGTAEYYLSESLVSDDAKGVGPMMMCYAQAAAVRPITESVPVEV